jgi:hypothetical protein
MNAVTARSLSARFSGRVAALLLAGSSLGASGCAVDATEQSVSTQTEDLQQSGAGAGGAESTPPIDGVGGAAAGGGSSGASGSSGGGGSSSSSGSSTCTFDVTWYSVTLYRDSALYDHADACATVQIDSPYHSPRSASWSAEPEYGVTTYFLGSSSKPLGSFRLKKASPLVTYIDVSWVDWRGFGLAPFIEDNDNVMTLDCDFPTIDDTITSYIDGSWYATFVVRAVRR